MADSSCQPCRTVGQTDIDLARRPDVADLETVGRKAVFHQPGFLDADHFLLRSGMMKPADGAQTWRTRR